MKPKKTDENPFGKSVHGKPETGKFKELEELENRIKDIRKLGEEGIYFVVFPETLRIDVCLDELDEAIEQAEQRGRARQGMARLGRAWQG